MRKLKYNLSVVFCLWSLSLLGCNGSLTENFENTQETIYAEQLNTSEIENESDGRDDKAEVITLDMLCGEEGALVKELVTIPENVNLVGMIPDKSDDYAGNYCFVTNDKGAYYVSGFGESMGLTMYNLHICYYDYETKNHQLLYCSKDAIWINELCATNKYLVWLEHIRNDEGVIDYYVKLFELETREVRTLAVCGMDICIEMSDEYITWYDLGDEEHKERIVVYDIKKCEYSYLEEEIKLYAPYERLHIVDNGITYFSEEDGKKYVNQHNLMTGKVISFYLDNNQKLAGCFSNKDYIGWYTDYTSGIIHICEIKTGKHYELNTTNDLEYFDVMLYDKLYINDHKSNCIYAYDLDTHSAYYQKLDKAYIFSFYNTDKEKANVNVQFADRDGLTIMEFN